MVMKEVRGYGTQLHDNSFWNLIKETLKMSVQLYVAPDTLCLSVSRILFQKSFVYMNQVFFMFLLNFIWLFAIMIFFLSLLNNEPK